MGSASHCLEGLSQEGSGAPEPLCPSGSCGHTLAPAARWRAGLGPLLSVRSEVCRWCRGIQGLSRPGASFTLCPLGFNCGSVSQGHAAIVGRKEHQGLGPNWGLGGSFYPLPPSSSPPARMRTLDSTLQ